MNERINEGINCYADLDELQQDIHPCTLGQRLKEDVINTTPLFITTTATSTITDTSRLNLHPLTVVSWL